jgi:hypothetical protein
MSRKPSFANLRGAATTPIVPPEPTAPVGAGEGHPPGKPRGAQADRRLLRARHVARHAARTGASKH